MTTHVHRWKRETVEITTFSGPDPEYLAYVYCTECGQTPSLADEGWGFASYISLIDRAVEEFLDGDHR